MRPNIKYTLVWLLMMGICVCYIYGFAAASAGPEILPCGEPRTSPAGLQYYTVLDSMPVYKKGDIQQAIRQYLVYPSGLCVSGKSYMSFIIDEDGKMAEQKILRGIGKQADENALRALVHLDDWIPGRCNGKNVAFEYRLPISFDLH